MIKIFILKYYFSGPICWQACGSDYSYECAGVFCAMSKLECYAYLTELSAAGINLAISRPFLVKEYKKLT